jgi:MbtH protein
MLPTDSEDKLVYKAVVNHEEQYSVWPAERENPRGWADAGKSGTQAECLEYIKQVWTDITPLSVRQALVRQSTETNADGPTG